MNSKLTLYNALEALLLKPETGVKTFGFFNDQFEKEKKEQPKFYPAVFLEFVNIDYSSKSESLQEGDTLLRFHIGMPALEKHEQKILPIVDNIHFQLQNFSVDDLITPLDRKSEKQDTDHDGLIVWQMEYATLMTDNTANRKRKLVRMESIEELEIEKESSGYYLKPL